MNNATAAVQTAVVRVTPGEFLADSRAGVGLSCLVWTCFAGKIDFPLSHLLNKLTRSPHARLSRTVRKEAGWDHASTGRK
jgi:hypothetical protein